jgi:hypothetical protein
MVLAFAGDSTTTKLNTVKPLQESIVTVVKITDGDVSTVISEGLVGNTDLRAADGDPSAADGPILSALKAKSFEKKDLLTADEFKEIVEAVPNDQLRTQLSNYFASMLPKPDPDRRKHSTGRSCRT